jgi:hypothetical protein
MLRIARATAHSAGGWLAYKLGWHRTARRQFENVLLLRGANFLAYVHLGRIAFDHGDYAGWRREFEHARRTDPIRFARLRHPIELFEPRLAGTQFEGSHELDSFQATDSRATWRALHPFGPAPFRSGRKDDGRTGQNRVPEGFGRGTDLPLAPGYDPISNDYVIPGHHLGDGDAGHSDAGHSESGDPLAGDPLGQEDARREDQYSHRGDTNGSPGWNMPDAALSRDDFASPIERRRFQLRRPIDSQEIARCDFNELARRLSS